MQRLTLEKPNSVQSFKLRLGYVWNSIWTDAYYLFQYLCRPFNDKRSFASKTTKYFERHFERYNHPIERIIKFPFLGLFVMIANGLIIGGFITSVTFGGFTGMFRGIRNVVTRSTLFLPDAFKITEKLKKLYTDPVLYLTFIRILTRETKKIKMDDSSQSNNIITICNRENISTEPNGGLLRDIERYINYDKLSYFDKRDINFNTCEFKNMYQHGTPLYNALCGILNTMPNSIEEAELRKNALLLAQAKRVSRAKLKNHACQTTYTKEGTYQLQFFASADNGILKQIARMTSTSKSLAEAVRIVEANYMRFSHK